MSKSMSPTINTYISDTLALERHILQPLESQSNDDAMQKSANVARAVSEALTMVRSHIGALEQRLDAVGGHAGSPVKGGVASVLGAAASAIDNVRKTEVSKSLRDDYTALCLTSAAYTMLHTTALGLGDTDTATLAQQHLADTATVVMRLSSVLPSAVLSELQEEGVSVDKSVASQAERDIENAWKEGGSRTDN